MMLAEQPVSFVNQWPVHVARLYLVAWNAKNLAVFKAVDFKAKVFAIQRVRVDVVIVAPAFDGLFANRAVRHAVYAGVIPCLLAGAA